MIVPYVVFDLATGEALRWGQCQDETLDAQAGAGERALETSALTVDGNRMVIWTAAKVQRDQRINAGSPTPAGAVDSDDEARANISGATIAALIAKVASAPYLITWTMLDNSTVALDADGMIAVGLAVLAHVDACHANARALRAEIEGAANMAELLAVDVNAGWP